MTLADQYEQATGQAVETDLFGTVLFTVEYAEWLEDFIKELQEEVEELYKLINSLNRQLGIEEGYDLR